VSFLLLFAHSAGSNSELKLGRWVAHRDSVRGDIQPVTYQDLKLDQPEKTEEGSPLRWFSSPRMRYSPIVREQSSRNVRQCPVLVTVHLYSSRTLFANYGRISPLECPPVAGM
jgi:hypothetical protein